MTAPRTKRLWLVRHATPLVDTGTCYGALDVAADAVATHDAALRLHAALPAGAAVYSSPLRRSRQLGQALGALRLDLDTITDARLAEMNFGQWEGRPWDAIGAAALQTWTDDFAHHRPGGGESVREFMARVGAAFDACLASADTHDIAWITHAGVIRAALLVHAGVRDVTQAAQWPAEAPAFGNWQLLEIPAPICAAAVRA